MDELYLEYECKKIRAALCITKMEDLVLEPRQILSKIEMEKYNTFKTVSGKQEFLLGRYSAKRAYIQLNPQGSIKDIDIRNGIFEQPLLLGNSEFDVSITHTKSIGGAIVFDKAYPMGLDIETIEKEKTDVLQTLTEKKEIEKINLEYDAALTIAWCVKEALTKAIKTGLTISLDLLKIKDIIKTRNIFKCSFKSFAQYKGIAKINDNFVIALVYPQQLNVEKF